MFPMVIRTKRTKVIQSIYFRYSGAIWKLRNTLPVCNVRMFIVATHKAGLLHIGFLEDKSCVFRNSISERLPSLPSRNQGCLGSFWTHAFSDTFTGKTSFGSRVFTASAIWADVTRSKFSLLKLFVIKGSRTGLITKLLSSSILNYSHYLNYFTAVLAIIGRGVIQCFGTFVTNFIGGCTTEPVRFNGKHSFSFRYANAYGRILSKITLIAGRVNETFRIITGWSSPAARQAHTLEVASSNLAPVTNKATC